MHGAVVPRGNLLREDGAVDARGDGGEDQAPELGRLQRLHLTLHRVLDVETVTAGEGRPTRVAALSLGCRVPYARICS